MRPINENSVMLSYGSIQGLLYSLTILGTPSVFRIREQATDNLVRCIYNRDLYPKIVAALSERNAIVRATGHMSLDRARRTVNEMNVERIDCIDPLTDDEFLSLFGSAPEMTGELTTTEFIDQMRKDG